MENNYARPLGQENISEVKNSHTFKFNFLLNFPKRHKKASVLLSLFLTIVFLQLLLLVVVAYRAQKVYSAASAVGASLNERNLAEINSNLTTLSNENNNLKGAYKLTLPLRLVPFVSLFVADGEHAINSLGYAVSAAETMTSALAPYQEVLGLGGDGDGNSPERIDFLVDAIPLIIPKIGEVEGDLTKINDELGHINPDRYPKTIFGRNIRSSVTGVIESTKALSDVVERGSDLLSVSPYLLGSDEARNYLILFQNDKELRPTGGFMTAYTIASVDRGIFSPVSSSDIYTLDENYTPRIPAAPALIRYIQGPYVLDKNYRLRDINWSPDFSQSMEVFLEEAETAGLSGFDGVMAVDTELVVNILSAVGPVNVPGYGEFSTNFDERCNCPQVIYELESFSDVEGPIVWDPLDPTKIIYAPDNFDNRKEIIGPLMNAIIEKALTTPKENLPNLFNSLYKAFLEKHVLMYMHDEKVQTAISEFGIGGTLDDYTDDYVYINDANLGGRKSNLYVTQEVVHDVTQTDENTISRKVEITYKNPQPYDGWLNSVLPNWTRIYLPENAQVEDVSGFEDPGEVYEELGRKVISGGFRLRPQGVSRITITYKIPHKKGEVYNLTLQKQPGTSYPHHTINAAGDRSDVILSGDEHFSYEL